MWKKLRGAYEAVKWIVSAAVDAILRPRSR
jgi:hypothetical protein